MRNLIFFIFISILIFSYKKKEEVSIKKDKVYVINININNIKDGTKVFLKEQNNAIVLTIDSTYFKNKRASFTGKIETPKVLGVFIEDYRQGVYPIIEKGTISINGNTKDLTKSKINGTQQNELLNQYKKKITQINSKMNDLFHEFQKARTENNLKKIEGVNKSLRAINFEKNSYSIDFIRENSNSLVASMVLHSLANNNEVSKDTIAKLFQNLSDKIKKNEFSKSIEIILELDKTTKDSLFSLE